MQQTKFVEKGRTERSGASCAFLRVMQANQYRRETIRFIRRLLRQQGPQFWFLVLSPLLDPSISLPLILAIVQQLRDRQASFLEKVQPEPFQDPKH